MNGPTSTKRTPLWDAHRRLNGRMVSFGGWEMPVQYPTGILAESKAVRSTAGLFDVSHMGRLELHGPAARNSLESLTTNIVGSLTPGAGQYTLLLNENGGIIDDLILFCQEPNLYPLIVNAGNSAQDYDWIRSRIPAGAILTDRTENTALLALQGPLSATLLAESGAPETADLVRFRRLAARLFGFPIWAMRTGYTGEDGFEIQCAAESAVALWNGLLKIGGPDRLIPCGLGARDVLRIEAGYPLYGHEIDTTCNPWEAGLGWVIRKTNGFCGDEALAHLKEQAKRRLVGLVMETRSVARQGSTVYCDADPCGVVTSGTFSPNRNVSIALAYLDRIAVDVDRFIVESGGRRQGASRTPVPFVKLPQPRKKRA